MIFKCFLADFCHGLRRIPETLLAATCTHIHTYIRTIISMVAENQLKLVVAFIVVCTWIKAYIVAGGGG